METSVQRVCEKLTYLITINFYVNFLLTINRINYLSYLLAEIPSMFIALATIMKKGGFPLRESRGIFFGGSTHGSLPSDQVLASYYFFLGFGKILATTTIL